MMTAKDLYDEMKDMANYFGVGFRGFDKITVHVNDQGHLVFENEGRMVVLLCPLVVTATLTDQ